ncbi:chloride channel CLIC-like protein 1 [Clarias gariepinus]
MKKSGRLLLWSCSGFIVVSSLLALVCGHIGPEDDEWVDPTDMLNYDPITKSMRKTAEASSYNNVPTKRRDHNQDLGPVIRCPDLKKCTDRLNTLQRETEEFKRRVTFSSQQPTCIPVFKRFLAKLLKEIQKLGLPTAVTSEKHYDAEVKLSKQMVSEIQKLVNDESSWRTGALDDALSQILVNFKLHDYEAWKWRFEDTFGVELQTLIMITVLVLLIVVIICTEMWSAVSWFVQFKRMFALCFIISLVWNWFYLYKTAFAAHHASLVKNEQFNDKCTRVKKFDWTDNIKEWYRTTLTLQDDPCYRYYQDLIVNPVLLVPPTKAITMTIATFFTDPLKHIGEGISDFLRALLKDMPITLQIPVLLCVMLSILVFIYSTSQAAVHHALLRPLRGRRQDPPPSIAPQPAAPPLPEPEDHREQRYLLAGGDANRPTQLRHHVGQEDDQFTRMRNRTYHEDNRPEIRQRTPNMQRAEQQRVRVETVRHADSLYSGDETDTHEGAVAENVDQHVDEKPQTHSDEPRGEYETSATNTQIKQTQTPSKKQSVKRNTKDNKNSGNTERNEAGDSASPRGDKSKKEDCVENIGSPVQGTHFSS